MYFARLDVHIMARWFLDVKPPRRRRNKPDRLSRRTVTFAEVHSYNSNRHDDQLSRRSTLVVSAEAFSLARLISPERRGNFTNPFIRPPPFSKTLIYAIRDNAEIYNSRNAKMPLQTLDNYFYNSTRSGLKTASTNFWLRDPSRHNQLSRDTTLRTETFYPLRIITDDSGLIKYVNPFLAQRGARRGINISPILISHHRAKTDNGTIIIDVHAQRV